MTDRIALPTPDRYGDPTARLEPVAQALLARGYTQTRRGFEGSPFGPTKDGFDAVFAEPLDIEWIKATFELPESVTYDPVRDELFDRDSYTAIRGSSPAPQSDDGRANTGVPP